MNNVDFISEKWRTCRRTRNLARIHVASSIFPIIYVAVYAEAQRRDGDNKELGAALAALMFNVFQLMRTIMGIVQLNAFVAWCKDAVECMHALLGRDGEKGEQGVNSTAETSDEGGDSREESGGERRELNRLSQLQFQVIVTWCKRGVERLTTFVRGRSENNEQNSSTDEEDREVSADAHVSCGDDDIERRIEVNNTVVDNELGGKELTVLPSWKKMLGRLKKGWFEPSTWLRTDRVMLNTVRWSGAFLCGMGEHWGVVDVGSKKNAEMLETFFSEEMDDMRDVLRVVEWNIEGEDGSREILSIDGLENGNRVVDLTGEMSTAYGTGFRSYSVQDTYNVHLYSFEFDSLVGSYPASDDVSYFRPRNREGVTVELAHSLVLAKHLGVEKLNAIRRYYDHHHVPVGRIREDAFKLLSKQTESDIPDDSRIWWMFNSIVWRIPLFPYRMQAVALWDEAPNRRVLQASAHQDIRVSLSQIWNPERILNDAPQEVNIFDYCAEWTMEHSEGRGVLGVVIETVRTFLAEWIVASARDPIWEPEVPKDCFEFGLVETSSFFEPEVMDFYHLPRHRLTWVCQRELQRNVAGTSSKDENLPGNAALIMLFMLGFPLLRMENVQDAEIGGQECQDEMNGERALSASNRDSNVNVSVRTWRVWTVLAPQDISLMIRVDHIKGTVSLRLRNNGSEGRFVWQDWVDAAMGCFKGFEERDDDDCGYGRWIVRADLRKPMLELCPLRVNQDGIESVVKKTMTARVWLGWPVFDMAICKLEVDQWLAACDVKINRYVERIEAEKELEWAEWEIPLILYDENEDMEGSRQDDEI